MGLVTHSISDIQELLALAVDVNPIAAKELTPRIGCETWAKMKSQSKEHFPKGSGVIILTKCDFGCSSGCKKTFSSGIPLSFCAKAGYMLSTDPQ